MGVIPDPEILHSVSTPPSKEGGDGDLFVIVASDGVWEFIESVEACQLVNRHKNATEACSALVLEAAQRWKRFEGSYRDDITAIVAFLPFLEDEWPDEDDAEEDQHGHSGDADSSHVFVNMGQQGKLLAPNPAVLGKPARNVSPASRTDGARCPQPFAHRNLIQSQRGV